MSHFSFLFKRPLLLEVTNSLGGDPKGGGCPLSPWWGPVQDTQQEPRACPACSPVLLPALARLSRELPGEPGKKEAAAKDGTNRIFFCI